MGRKSDILGSCLKGWETTKNNTSSLCPCMCLSPASTHTDVWVFSCQQNAQGYICTYTHTHIYICIQTCSLGTNMLTARNTSVHTGITHTHTQWVRTEGCAHLCSHPQVHRICVLIHTRRWEEDADEQVGTLVVTTIDPCAGCVYGKVI